MRRPHILDSMRLHVRTRRFCLALALAAASGAVLASAPVRASLVLAMDLTEMTAEAERIVVGEVLSVRSAWDGKRQRILTTVELQVAETWKGTVPGDGRVFVVQPGGVADGIEMKVHGLPAFQAGERAVLFLRGSSARATGLVGMAQGKWPLRFDPALKQWMVDPGDRTSLVTRGIRGQLEPAAPEAIVPLDEMRRRVSKLVKR